MKYASTHGKTILTDSELDIVEDAVNDSSLLWDYSRVNDDVSSRHLDTDLRSSQVSWIYDSPLSKLLYGLMSDYNRSEWNLRITNMEPIQYAIYSGGDYFDWHKDQQSEITNGKIRKISMTLMLSNPSEYEGGELDLEFGKPNDRPRYDSFKMPLGGLIFFQSDVWHRVRPVKAGVRKSLVAWFSGPPYI